MTNTPTAMAFKPRTLKHRRGSRVQASPMAAMNNRLTSMEKHMQELNGLLRESIEDNRQLRDQLQMMSFQRSLADMSLSKDQSSRCSRTETFSQLVCSIGATIPKHDGMADTQSAESMTHTPQQSLRSRPIACAIRKNCTETVTQNTVTLSPDLSKSTANGHLVPITQYSGNTHGVTSSTSVTVPPIASLAEKHPIIPFNAFANTSFQAEPTRITKIGIADNDNDVRSTQSTGIVAPSRFPITSMEEDSQRIQRPDAITQTQLQPFSFPSWPNKIEQTNDKSPKPGIKAIQQSLVSRPSTKAMPVSSASPKPFGNVFPATSTMSTGISVFQSKPASSKPMVFAAKHQETQQPSPATPSTGTSVAHSNPVGQQTTQQPQRTPFVLAEGTPNSSFGSLTSSSTEAFKASGDFKGFQGAGQQVFSGKHSSPREQSRSLNEDVKIDDTEPNDDSEQAVELQDHDDMQTGEQEEIASQAQMFSFNTESLISIHKTTEPNDGKSVNANSEVMPVSSAAPLTPSTGTSVAQSKPAGQQTTQAAQSTDCPFELTQIKPSLPFGSLTSNVTEAFNESADFIDFREGGQQVFDGQHSKTLDENDKMDDTESNEEFKPEVEPQDHDDMQTGEHVKQKLVENQAQQSPSPRTGNITISEVEPNMDLFAMFKQQVAPWKCDRCFIHNDSCILKCSVCYSLKPGVEAEDVNV